MSQAVLTSKFQVLILSVIVPDVFLRFQNEITLDGKNIFSFRKKVPDSCHSPLQEATKM